MKIIEDIFEKDLSLKGCYIAIGTFDGIHKGHKEVISRCVLQSKKDNKKSVVLTFSNHPKEETAKKAPLSLTNEVEKYKLIENLGVDILITQRFTKDFSNLTSEIFVKEFLGEKLGAERVYVGYNFSFGKGGVGTPKLLKELGEKKGIYVEKVDEVLVDGKKVSSTIIREKVSEGDLESVKNLLGHHYFVIGEVVHGRKLGRTIGFPTANLEIEKRVNLPFGIYGVDVMVEGKAYSGVCNIGKNPTLKPGEKSIEVYILDFNKDIYGKNIKVIFLEYIREEKKFTGIEKLKEAIQSDIKYWESRGR